MAAIKKIEVEDFAKERLQLGQPDRYSQFKVVVDAEAGAQNVRQLLKQGAQVYELEEKKKKRKALENKRDLYRAWEVAKDKAAAAMERAGVFGGAENWIQYGEAYYDERKAEIAAQQGNATVMDRFNMDQNQRVRG